MEILIQLSGFTMAHFLLFYLLLHTSDTLAKPCTKCLLLQAASIGDVHAFKKHLFNGCDINQMDQMGTTALYYASENNYPSIVKIILNQDKVNIDAAPTLSGATPLFIAIQEGHYEIFNLLLNAGSNTTISTSNNVTPLMIASHSTKDDYLKPLLLSSQHVRQSVNTASPTTGHTVLHMSAMKGSMENVKVLLKYAGGFTDCNQVNSVNGATALWYATSGGHVNIVKYLLKTCEGIDIDTPDTNQWTPFMVASRLGHTEIMNELYMFKKNNALKMDLINSKSMHQTPLIIASHAKQLKTVEYLLSRDGILVNDRVHDGWNALMVACEVGSTSIVSALMKHPKIEVRIMRNNGYSALHQACLGGHNEIVQLLLPAMTTSFINLEGKDNQTPLSLAVWNNHSDVVNSLSRDGRVHVDKPIENDIQGRTPFHVAAQYGYFKIIEILAKNKKVNIIREDKNKQTPLDLSRSHAHPKVEKYIAKLIKVKEMKFGGRNNRNDNLYKHEL